MHHSSKQAHSLCFYVQFKDILRLSRKIFEIAAVQHINIAQNDA